MRDVAVAGVGMAPFGRFPDTPVYQMGVTAALAALDDAGMSFREMGAAYCGVVNQGMTPGTRVFADIGLTGVPIVNIDNASASGSSAFREAYLAVAGGLADSAIAVGMGKMGSGPMGTLVGPDPHERALGRAQAMTAPAGAFAMRANRRMHDFGTTVEHYAKVAVKNRKHASLNPYAQYRSPITLEDVMNARMICDPLTMLHCCPTGDGAAAAIVTTVERARQLGAPLITVAASAFRSELYSSPAKPQPDITELTAREAYEQAGLGPEDIDLVQIHDAFTVEEIEYYESLGFAAKGEGERLIDEGATTIGGRIPFSTDGGLLSRGHPLGPTGLAQVWETVVQLRGTAGERQVQGAKVGLLHMIGAGGVCICHVLKR